MHINHDALIYTVAAHTHSHTHTLTHTHTHTHTHRLDSNCPFLSVVETAGLCHVNERGEVKLK